MARSSAACPLCCCPNHGVLVFHRTPELAILVGGVVEEAAQAGHNPERSAARLGTAAGVGDLDGRRVLQRAMAFDSSGTAHA